MGNCVQCYPCIIKSNLENNQSSVYVPPIIDVIEKKEQNDKNITENNLNSNEIKISNIDKAFNYGPTLEKNELDEIISPNNKNTQEPIKNKNLLHINNDIPQRRRLYLL